MEIGNLNNVVVQLVNVLEELIVIETKKLSAVLDNNLSKLDELVRTEQAMVLKLKGIEKKREEVQCQLGVKNLTFKEIIQMLPEEEKNTSIELFNNLENATKRFNEINSSARVAIEINLHSIKKILDKLNGHKAKNDDGQGFTAMRV